MIDTPGAPDVGSVDIAEADYFDGLSARACPVLLRVVNGHLQVQPRGEGVALSVPLADVTWPERTRHGQRVTHLRAGGSLQARDALAWDAWARRALPREALVVRAQQSWRGTSAAVLLLIALALAGYLWGVPVLARSALALTPPGADKAIGDAALHSFEGRLLLPSHVPLARQQALRERFKTAVARTYSAGERPVYELRFHTSPTVAPSATPAEPKSDDKYPPADTARRTQIGPNAFALPGGTIVVTDEMLALLDGRDDVLLGVLGHELGHVQRRHGMRLVVQAAVIGTAASLAWGDFSSLLAAAPVLLGQSAYSRDFEREADADAVRLLRANGVPPAVMADLFERLAASRPKGDTASTVGDALGIALASHPADAERMRGFREAAR